MVIKSHFTTGRICAYCRLICRQLKNETVDWQQYTVHRWQNIVYGLQISEIKNLVYRPGLVALETSSRVAKYCVITGSSQITFRLLITLPFKLMSTQFRRSLQQQFGSLAFLFLSLSFSILERNHQLKYGSCFPCTWQLQTCKLVMALSQRLTRLLCTKVCLETEVENTYFIAIQYACRNGSVMQLLVLAS